MMQRYLNLIMEGPLGNYNIRFGDMAAPWLVNTRETKLSCLIQEKELYEWELASLKSSDITTFYPLVDALLSEIQDRGHTLSELSTKLSSCGLHFGKMSAHLVPLGYYIAQAERVCFLKKMFVLQKFDKTEEVSYRLSDSKRPFKLECNNIKYFNRAVIPQIHSNARVLGPEKKQNNAAKER